VAAPLYADKEQCHPNSAGAAPPCTFGSLNGPTRCLAKAPGLKMKETGSFRYRSEAVQAAAKRSSAAAAAAEARYCTRFIKA
jgi:hypothetical protein